MSIDATTPEARFGPPVRAIRVSVVRGPDEGSSATFETDHVTVGTADHTSDKYSANDVVLRDPLVSRFHLEVRRAQDRLEIRDLDSTNGTHIGPVTLHGQRAAVVPGTQVTLGNSVVRLDDGDWLLPEEGTAVASSILGRSPAIERLRQRVAKLARSTVPVTITGESGTGKELVARALHEGSERAARPFVVVDCAAMSPTLFASELFGHERGAFTGAERRHEGAFERAHGGTLFLDEVGDLSADLQAALLGVLERRTLRRVGGREDIPVDVRVVSATWRDLREEVNRGRFRLDLHYRLGVVRLEVPPLRERTEDLPMLVERFVSEEGADAASLFTPAVLAELGKRPWPGNVRELRNVVQGALALGEPPDRPLGAHPAGSGARVPFKQARREALDAFERHYLTSLFGEAQGNVRAAARAADVDRTYLTELLRRHGLIP